MQIKGEYLVPAPRERVWEYFTDAELLKQCIPGCEELKPSGDDVYEATLTVGVAAIKGTYKGKVKLENQQPPSSYRLVVSGESKIGHVKGNCDFSLAEKDGEGTEVTLIGDLSVGGQLARVGQRIIGGVAKMMMGQFFKAVEKLARSQ